MARFARGSTPWLLTPLLLMAAVLLIGMQYRQSIWFYVALLPLLIFVFFLVFFRDPERVAAEGLASPADGVVRAIDEVNDADLGQVQRYSIFMSPKDVHVNRFPLDGTVVSVKHIAGGHIPAFSKDAERNERVETLIDTTSIGRVKVIQIAGTLARRIVPYISGGEVAVKGVRMGLIRLGSRCDILVKPGSVEWLVPVGTQVHAGSTQLGRLAGAKK